LNIFIYGNASFKSDIHKIFARSNIKFRLSESDAIQEINTLIELRTAIENHPTDIFLIDDAKIYRKNALNEKIKFLKPNDAIEAEFIKEHGIDDISVNSLEELPKHIIKKLEESNDSSYDDDYTTSRENIDIQESIISIVDDAYSEQEGETNTNNESTSNIDEENDKIQLDDELSSLLVCEEPNEIAEEDELEATQTVDEFSLDEDIHDIEDILVEEDLQTQDANKIDELEGENMSDEFSELDNLNESDILAALDGLDNIDINSVSPSMTTSNHGDTVTNNVGVELNGSNVNDIASLITQLLNNKTLEITIKVKA